MHIVCGHKAIKYVHKKFEITQTIIDSLEVLDTSEMIGIFA